MRQKRLTRGMGILSIALIGTGLLVGHAGLVAAQEGEAGPAGPVEFTSSFAWSHQPAPGEREVLADGTTVATGEAWQFRNLESSDPRLAGTLTLTDTLVTYPGGATVSVGAFRIENDGCAWQETPVYWRDWDGQRQPGATWQRAFVGEGGYAGLIAVVVDTWRPENGVLGTDIQLDGFIVTGELPRAPEPWSTPADG